MGAVLSLLLQVFLPEPREMVTFWQRRNILDRSFFTPTTYKAPPTQDTERPQLLGVNDAGMTEEAGTNPQ